MTVGFHSFYFYCGCNIDLAFEKVYANLNLVLVLIMQRTMNSNGSMLICIHEDEREENVV